MRAVVPPEVCGDPRRLLASGTRRTAIADLLHRALAAALRDRSRGRGSGESGELAILAPGQQVLRRTSLLVHPDGAVEARFRAGLPARGRPIPGHEAARLLREELPAAVGRALRTASLDPGALRLHVETVEDARVRAPVAKEHEPITPSIDRARELHREHGVSVVPVVGGSGDYFDVADTVVAMRAYEPHEVTAEAKEGARPVRRRAPRPAGGAGVPDGVAGEGGPRRPGREDRGRLRGVPDLRAGRRPRPAEDAGGHSSISRVASSRLLRPSSSPLSFSRPAA